MTSITNAIQTILEEMKAQRSELGVTHGWYTAEDDLKNIAKLAKRREELRLEAARKMTKGDDS